MKNGYKNKNVFVLVIGCFCLAITLFGCKTKRNIVESESKQATSNTYAAKTDTSSTVIKTETNMDETISIQETTDRETIHLDSIGRVRTIVRESISSQTGTGRTYRGQGSVVSVNGLETITVSNKDSVIERSVTDKSITDTRPVQGFEMFWIMLVIGCLLLTVGFIMYKRFKR